jgi:hypothetical protein
MFAQDPAFRADYRLVLRSYGINVEVIFFRFPVLYVLVLITIQINQLTLVQEDKRRVLPSNNDSDAASCPGPPTYVHSAQSNSRMDGWVL